MKKWSVVIGLLAMTFFAPGNTAARAQGEIQWVRTIDSALMQAKVSGKPVMLYFYANRCENCKQLEKETYLDGRVLALAEEFVSFKINAERGQGTRLAQTYGVRGFPNIMFLTHEGEIKGMIGGFLPANDYVVKMARFLQDYAEERMEKEAETNRDAAALARLSVMYAVLGDLEEASDYLDKAEQANAKSADPAKNASRLAAAYLAVGDCYVAEEDYENAILYMAKAATVADDMGDMIVARLRLAQCYILADEADKARPFLDAILEMKQASRQEQQSARELLEKAKRAEQENQDGQ